MLKGRSTNRLNALASVMVMALAGWPIVVTLAVEPEQKVEGAAVLRGRVQSEIGGPLAGVSVRVAVPATDMRFVTRDGGPVQFETISDDNGNYRLEIAGISKPTTVSVEATKPGYGRLSGMLMRGGPPVRPVVLPSGTVEANLKLDATLYFKGTVVDEGGKPIPGVEISANANTGRSSGGVERTVSNQDGEFELFNYPVKPAAIANESTKGVVYFSHPDYVAIRIEDVYAFAENERAVLRVILGTGHKVAGVVLDTAGKPVPGVMVKAISSAGGHRKAVMTDSEGRFTLVGLIAGPTVLSTRALELMAKIQMPIDVDRDISGLDLRLQAMEMPADIKRYTVLGMTLTDTTPEVRAAYDLHDGAGALILDPGADSARLQIGELKHGYNFWMVGNTSVSSVRDFVDRILAEAAAKPANQYSIRVVYSFSRLEFDGTNTQYLRLTQDDIDRLKAF